MHDPLNQGRFWGQPHQVRQRTLETTGDSARHNVGGSARRNVGDSARHNVGDSARHYDSDSARRFHGDRNTVQHRCARQGIQRQVIGEDVRIHTGFLCCHS